MDFRECCDVDYDKPASKKQNASTPTCTGTQTHVHEFEESTKLAEEGDDRHNHRVAGVTSEVILIGNGRHVHAFGVTNTDFLDHHHEIGGTTGPNIPIPNSTKHVHLISGTTTTDDGHEHDFLFTTQINSPLV
ncbi:YmaF family protein [Clostridium saccharoperbutylacetonicum]|uniref:YmaF family protein n=1 Tax=Clostridium saccharoperbutylacetonicum TaxID=36745 RepID=UPI0039EC23D1